MNEQIKNIHNTRIREIADKCVNRTNGDFGMVIEGGVDLEKFAEFLVKECIYTLQLKIVRNGNTPENLRSREHIRDLGEKFGIEFPMDYYPDRNKDFGVEE